MAINWQSLTSVIGQIVRVAAPLIEGVVSGEVGAAVGVAARIIEGAVKAEPAAVALLDQIKGGSNPTVDQLKKYMADYDAAHDDLNVAIDEAEARNAAANPSPPSPASSNEGNDPLTVDDVASKATGLKSTNKK